jgi:RimJ/RimL family protein N-acetyltransferase
MHATVGGSTMMGEDIRLKDGTSCRLRPLSAHDQDFMLACFDGLSPQSRRRRFFGVKSTLSTSELAFLTSADGHDHIALGVVRLNASGEEVEPLGAGRCIRVGPNADTGELALAVVDAAQGLGLGAVLLGALVKRARQGGIGRLRCEVMTDNLGMRALLERLGGQARWLEEGVLEYDCPLVEPPGVFKSAPFFSPDLLTPLGSDAAIWTSGLEQIFDVSFQLVRAFLEHWFDHWPLGWAALAETWGREQRFGRGAT